MSVRLFAARRWGEGFALGGVVGLVAAGVAIGVGELVAVSTGPGTAPVAAVGAAAIDFTPTPLKEYAVHTFGAHDKAVLLVGIFAVLGLIAIVAGVLALRWPLVGAAIVTCFGAVGALAAATRPMARPTAIWPSLAAAVAGSAAIWALAALHRRAWPPTAPARAPADSTAKVPPAEPTGGARGRVGSRRGFVAATAGTAAASALAGIAGRALLGRRYDVSAARARVRVPDPAHPAAPLPPAAHPPVRGLSPFYTPNEEFYRVDTELGLPQVDPASWTLRILGMVDRPTEITFDQLLHLPLTEHDFTLSCVSNEVGGSLVGNARWIGARLPDLLRSAGVQAGADQLVGRSTDGFTTGVPLDAVLDGREALLAVAMNGQPLPISHGFPCRMLVPGFYGYAGATKWLTELEVTTFAARTPYWVQRGWDRMGVGRTASRIDVPTGFTRLTAGPVSVAGIAWASHRGIARVEVRVDHGPWTEADLAPADGSDTWRQWTTNWDATSGTHQIQVRATDGTGALQPETRVPPFPSGSTGWHTIVVTVH
ncbi:molybdopterin-dependent oxidoreductase [Streptomyces sp. NPDC001020]